MPGCVRKNDKAKKIASDILGENNVEFVDSFGNIKKRRKKRGYPGVAEVEVLNVKKVGNKY